MANISWTKDWSVLNNGENISGTDLGNIQSDITAVVNSGISNVNISASAAIALSKINFNSAFTMTVASGVPITIANSGTNSSISITASGILATGKHGLIVTGSGITVAADSALVKLENTAVGMSEPVLQISSNATTGAAAAVLEINSSGDKNGIRILHTTAPSSAHCLYVSCTASTIAVDSALVKFVMDHASSSEPVLEIDNNGTGAGIEIDSNIGSGLYITNAAVMSTTKHLAYLYSNVANIAADAALLKVYQDHASSTEPALELKSDATGVGGHALEIDFTAQVTDTIAFLKLTNATSTVAVGGGVTPTLGTDAPAAIGTTAASKWLPMNVAGTMYYLAMWT